MTTRAIRWRRATLILLAAALAWYFFSPPILFERAPSAQARQAGHDLFVHDWKPHDPQAHLLRRATFGARPKDVGQLKRLGIDRWLERQLDPKSIKDSTAKKP